MRGSVLLVGPDGAGKTTLLDALDRRLTTPAHRAHSRPGLIAGRADGAAPVVDPHGQQPRGTLASLAKLALVFVDTIVGVRVRWRPQARSGLLVIERGWYDLAVDPRRYRLPAGFSGLVRLLGWAVPKVDLVVLMTGDPAQLHRRKPEIGVAEVQRQLAAWRGLASRAGHHVLELDTVATPVAECVDQIVAALALPARRWFRVPLAPRRLGFVATGASPALDIYRPYAPRARRLAPLNKPLLRLRLVPPSPPPAIPDLPALLAGADEPVTGMAAFQSSARGRWILGLADRRHLHTVVKVGTAADDCLAAELRTLQSLTAAPGIMVPKVAWVSRGDDWMAVGYDALPLQPDEPDLESIVHLATQLVLGALGTPLAHGDFAPWNMARVPGGFALWDFEQARLGVRAPLYDLTHYFIVTGALLGRYSPAEVVGHLTSKASLGSAHLMAVDVDPATAPALVEEYLRQHPPRSDVERRFQDAVAAALPTG